MRQHIKHRHHGVLYFRKHFSKCTPQIRPDRQQLFAELFQHIAISVHSLLLSSLRRLGHGRVHTADIALQNLCDNCGPLVSVTKFYSVLFCLRHGNTHTRQSTSIPGHSFANHVSNIDRVFLGSVISFCLGQQIQHGGTYRLDLVIVHLERGKLRHASKRHFITNDANLLQFPGIRLQTISSLLCGSGSAFLNTGNIFKYGFQLCLRLDLLLRCCHAFISQRLKSGNSPTDSQPSQRGSERRHTLDCCQECVIGTVPEIGQAILRRLQLFLGGFRGFSYLTHWIREIILQGHQDVNVLACHILLSSPPQ